VKNFLKDITSLLTRQELKEASILLVFVVLMAFLELMGVALIAPFLSLLLNAGVEGQSKYLQVVYSWLGFKEYTTFLYVYGAVLIGVIWVSGLFKSYTMYRLYDFTYAKDYTLSTRLFKTYLLQPYEFFLQRNSSDLTKNILSEVSVVVVGILVTGMQAFAKLCIIIAIVTFLFFINPMLIFVVGGTFLAVYLGIYFFFHSKLQEMGAMRHKLVEVRFNDVKEAFMAIKETKVYGYENYFLDSYAKNSSVISKFSSYRDTIAQSPAYLVEAVGFTILIAAMLYVLGTSGANINEIIPALSTYAFAGYKLLPNIQQVFSGIARIKYTIPTLSHLVKEFALLTYLPANFPKESLGANEEEKEDIYFSEVSFCYKGASSNALSDVNLCIPSGSIVGVVGRTGAGKTTLVDLCLGLLQPSSGRVHGSSSILDSSNFFGWKERFSYVSQNVCLFNDTILQNICMIGGGQSPDFDRVEMVLKIVDLDEFVTGLPNNTAYIIGENGNKLSGGQRQRLSLARALYRNANILILDEATSALDKQTEKRILQGIKGIGKTVIMITHRLEHLRICDSIIYLKGAGHVDVGEYDALWDKYPQFRLMVSGPSNDMSPPL